MNIANPSWVCDRATALRPLLSGNGIRIGTGGGADIDDSIIDQHFACAAIDLVGVHSYNAGAWAARLGGIVSKAKQYGKRIIVEEFGQAGGDRATSLAGQIAAIRNAGVPWIVWQVTKPNKPQDFEIWKDDAAVWPVLTTQAQQSLAAGGAFSWPELGSSTVPACTVANCNSCAAGSATTCAACNTGYTLSNGQCSLGECGGALCHLTCRHLGGTGWCIRTTLPPTLVSLPLACLARPVHPCSTCHRLRPERLQGRRRLVRMQPQQCAGGRRHQLLPPQRGGDQRRLRVQGRLHLGGPRLRCVAAALPSISAQLPWNVECVHARGVLCTPCGPLRSMRRPRFALHSVGMHRS